MYCKKCGKQISDDANFCKYCGTEFVKKETVNGQTVVKKIKQEKKLKNKNAIVSIGFAIGAFIGCMLPFSTFGWMVIVGVVIFAGLALLFRVRGKNEMYQLYDTNGLLVGKNLLTVSLCVSVLCLVLALVSITRFI